MKMTWDNWNILSLIIINIIANKTLAVPEGSKDNCPPPPPPITIVTGNYAVKK